MSLALGRGTRFGFNFQSDVLAEEDRGLLFSGVSPQGEAGGASR